MYPNKIAHVPKYPMIFHMATKNNVYPKNGNPVTCHLENAFWCFSKKHFPNHANKKTDFQNVNKIKIKENPNAKNGK